MQEFAIVAAILTALSSISGQYSPIVETKTGPIRGRLIEISPAVQVYQFTGIPYAEPPIGHNRFKKTKPVEPWTQTKDAFNWPPSCLHQKFAAGSPTEKLYDETGIVNPLTESSEDCLFLNIWVPKQILDRLLTSVDDAPELLAAYTFIHGGDFYFGGSALSAFNGSVLASYNNIVVATIQYRIGSLGFAYQGNEDAPGNMGLWDQVEALKWLCENLWHFGGNCSRHTIGGQGSGAASVAIHMLSPYSRPYFKRAILQSGSALMPDMFASPKVMKQATQMLTEKIEDGLCFLDTELESHIDCLRTIPFKSFPGADQAVAKVFGNFRVVVDGDFLPGDPLEMLRKGDFYKIPTLLGHNKDEGSFYLLSHPAILSLLGLPTPSSDGKDKVKHLNVTSFNYLMTAASQILSRNEDKVIFETVKHQYWPNKVQGLPYGPEVIQAAVDSIGDYLINCPTLTWAQVMLTHGNLGGNIYAYEYTYRPKYHYFPSWMGTTHLDELTFIFGEPLAPYARNYGYSQDERTFSRALMAYWSSFIKYGNPNLRDFNSINIRYGYMKQRPWPPFNRGECPYKVFDLSAESQIYTYGKGYKCQTKARQCSFWNSAFTELVNVLHKSSS